MSDEAKFVGKDVMGRDVFMAETDSIDAYPKEINKLLLAVGEHMGWHGDLSHVFVSDLSSMSDFGLGDDELKTVIAKIGVPLKASEYLVEIAKRMKEAGEKSQ